MKLEKRSEGAPDRVPPEEVPAQTDAAKGGQKKPVIVYIMILFSVACLLMALSFVMHQRSNDKVIGTLQSSVPTFQELQAAKDETITLQEELRKTQKDLQALQDQLEQQSAAARDQEETTAALTDLYCLQQEYAAGEYAACKRLIRSMEDGGRVDALPTTLFSPETDGAVTPPSQRYEQLKEAVLAH